MEFIARITDLYKSGKNSIRTDLYLVMSSAIIVVVWILLSIFLVALKNENDLRDFGIALKVIIMVYYIILGKSEILRTSKRHNAQLLDYNIIVRIISAVVTAALVIEIFYLEELDKSTVLEVKYAKTIMLKLFYCLGHSAAFIVLLPILVELVINTILYYGKFGVNSFQNLVMMYIVQVGLAIPMLILYFAIYLYDNHSHEKDLFLAGAFAIWALAHAMVGRVASKIPAGRSSSPPAGRSSSLPAGRSS